MAWRRSYEGEETNRAGFNQWLLKAGGANLAGERRKLAWAEKPGM
jgi:hypothetical protein